tara:strand:- start:2008 stop:2664 length:657 start_codon:yes stop_codon:yes gene_type:complete
MKVLLGLIATFYCFSLSANDFPAHWWAPVDGEVPSWEITPDKAEPGVELILSKRNELGVFSNFGAASFRLEGIRYASVEGLWQMMKYPDSALRSDPRSQFNYPFTRDQVRGMAGFEGKRAGKSANEINRENNIDWVSYRGEKFNYKDFGAGSQRHYEIIREGIRQKVLQNSEVKELLLSTGNLKLLPDHTLRANSPPSYYYFEILMELRAELQIGKIN